MNKNSGKYKSSAQRSMERQPRKQQPEVVVSNYTKVGHSPVKRVNSQSSRIKQDDQDSESGMQ